LVSVLREELPVCLFYSLPSVCATLRVTSPPLISIRSALKTAGYDSSISHTDPTAIKTTAPNSVVWDVFRGWNKLNPAKNLVEGSAASAILAKEPSIQANFDVHAAFVKSKKKKFQGSQKIPPIGGL